VASNTYQYLVGHRFPGGRYTLHSYLCWLWADAVETEPDAAVAHPSLGYFLAMKGLGVSIQEVFRMLDADDDSGVLMGEVELEFDAPLVPGASYDCQARIAGVDRKRGARTGPFDRLLLDFRVSQADSGEPVLGCTAAWIFPRAEA
jgi:hypothetical protein